MRRLGRNLPADVQGGGLRVEVGAADADEQCDVHARGGGGAGGGGGGYAAEGLGFEEVGGLDEVVGVPLGKGVSDVRGRGGATTMSSGSSGLRVMVPEPSRSMCCLINCMIGDGLGCRGQSSEWE